MILRAGHHLPDSIEHTLKLIIRRARRIIVLRGSCVVLAVGFAALLAGMAVDAGIVLFSPAARWTLTACVYAAIAWTVCRAIIKPLSHTFTLTGIARIIDLHHPELQERISSAVELVSSDDDPDTLGSEALIAKLVEEAQRDVQLIRPRQEVSLKLARRQIAWATTALLLMLLICIGWPRQAPRLALRTAAPFLNLPNLRAEDLSVRPGDLLCMAGEPLEISVGVANAAVNDAQLLVVNNDGDENPIRMKRSLRRDDDRRWFLTSAAPTESDFRYRVRAGDAVSRYYDITVVPRPAAEYVEVRYTYPEYTQTDPVQVRLTTPDIRGVAGTTVRVSAKLNKPMSNVLITFDGKPAGIDPVVRTTSEGEIFAEFELALEAGLDTLWDLRLTDEHGFSSIPSSAMLTAVPDTKPVIELEIPQERELRMPSDGRIPLRFTADDDFGIQSIQLIGATDKTELDPIELQPVSDGLLRSITRELPLRLSDYDLTGATRFVFQIRVTDTLPESHGGPHKSLSEAVIVLLDSTADFYKVQQLKAQTKEVREGIEEARKALQAARSEIDQLNRTAGHDRRMTDAFQQRVNSLQRHLAAGSELTSVLAQTIDDGYYDGQDDRLAEILNDALRSAQLNAAQMELTDDPGRRLAFLDEANEAVDESLEDLQSMLDELDDMARVLRHALEAEELAERQAELAAAEWIDDENAATVDPDEDLPGTLPRLTPSQRKREQDAILKHMANSVRANPDALSTTLTRYRDDAAQLAGNMQRAAAQKKSVDTHVGKLAALDQQRDKIVESRPPDTNPPAPGTAAPDPLWLAEQLARADAGDAGDPVEVFRNARGLLDLDLDRARRELATANLARDARSLMAPAARLGEEIAQARDELDRRGSDSVRDVLAPMAQPRRELARVADDLREQSGQASPLARRAMEIFDPAEHFEEAAQAVDSKRPMAALRALQAAAEDSRKLAEALDAAELAGKARELATRQEQLARLAAEAERKHRQAHADAAETSRKALVETAKAERLEGAIEEELGTIKKRQVELAKQAEQLEDLARTDTGSTNFVTVVPSAAMRKAAEAMQSDAAKPLEAADDAHRDLLAFADQLNTGATGTAARASTSTNPAPELAAIANVARQATQLADEQREIAVRLKELEKESSHELKAMREAATTMTNQVAEFEQQAQAAEAELRELAAPQEKIEAQTADLLNTIADEAAELVPRTDPAATNAMRQTALALAGDDPVETAPAQMAEAAAGLDTIAETLEDHAIPVADRLAHDAGAVARRQRDVAARAEKLADELTTARHDAADAGHRAAEAQSRVDQLTAEGIQTPAEMARDALAAHAAARNDTENASEAMQAWQEAMQDATESQASTKLPERLALAAKALPRSSAPAKPIIDQAKNMQAAARTAQQQAEKALKTADAARKRAATESQKTADALQKAADARNEAQQARQAADLARARAQNAVGDLVASADDHAAAHTGSHKPQPGEDALLAERAADALDEAIALGHSADAAQRQAEQSWQAARDAAEKESVMRDDARRALQNTAEAQTLADELQEQATAKWQDAKDAVTPEDATPSAALPHRDLDRIAAAQQAADQAREAAEQALEVAAAQQDQAMEDMQAAVAGDRLLHDASRDKNDEALEAAQAAFMQKRFENDPAQFAAQAASRAAEARDQAGRVAGELKRGAPNPASIDRLEDALEDVEAMGRAMNRPVETADSIFDDHIAPRLEPDETARPSDYSVAAMDAENLRQALDEYASDFKEQAEELAADKALEETWDAYKDAVEESADTQLALRGLPEIEAADAMVEDLGDDPLPEDVMQIVDPLKESFEQLPPAEKAKRLDEMAAAVAPSSPGQQEALQQQAQALREDPVVTQAAREAAQAAAAADAAAEKLEQELTRHDDYAAADLTENVEAVQSMLEEGKGEDAQAAVDDLAHAIATMTDPFAAVPQPEPWLPPGPEALREKAVAAQQEADTHDQQAEDALQQWEEMLKQAAQAQQSPALPDALAAAAQKRPPEQPALQPQIAQAQQLQAAANQARQQAEQALHTADAPLQKAAQEENKAADAMAGAMDAQKTADKAQQAAYRARREAEKAVREALDHAPAKSTQPSGSDAEQAPADDPFAPAQQALEKANQLKHTADAAQTDADKARQEAIAAAKEHGARDEAAKAVRGAADAQTKAADAQGAATAKWREAIAAAAPVETQPSDPTTPSATPPTPPPEAPNTVPTAATPPATEPALPTENLDHMDAAQLAAALARKEAENAMQVAAASRDQSLEDMQQGLEAMLAKRAKKAEGNEQAIEDAQAALMQEQYKADPVAFAEEAAKRAVAARDQAINLANQLRSGNSNPETMDKLEDEIERVEAMGEAMQQPVGAADEILDRHLQPKVASEQAAATPAYPSAAPMADELRKTLDGYVAELKENAAELAADEQLRETAEALDEAVTAASQNRSELDALPVMQAADELADKIMDAELPVETQRALEPLHENFEDAAPAQKAQQLTRMAQAVGPSDPELKAELEKASAAIQQDAAVKQAEQNANQAMAAAQAAATKLNQELAKHDERLVPDVKEQLAEVQELLKQKNPAAAEAVSDQLGNAIAEMTNPLGLDETYAESDPEAVLDPGEAELIEAQAENRLLQADAAERMEEIAGTQAAFGELAREQQALADETAAIREEATEKLPDAPLPVTLPDPTEDMTQAAEALAAAAPESAVHAAAAAAREADALAKHLGEAPVEDLAQRIQDMEQEATQAGYGEGMTESVFAEAAPESEPQSSAIPQAQPHGQTPATAADESSPTDQSPMEQDSSQDGFGEGMTGGLFAEAALEPQAGTAPPSQPQAQESATPAGESQPSEQSATDSPASPPPGEPSQGAQTPEAGSPAQASSPPASTPGQAGQGSEVPPNAAQSPTPPSEGAAKAEPQLPPPAPQPIDFAEEAKQIETAKHAHDRLFGEAVKLKQQESETAKAIRDAELSRLQEEQQRLAAEALELAEEIAAIMPDADIAVEGALDMVEAAVHMGAGSPKTAQPAATQAREALQQLSDNLAAAAQNPDQPVTWQPLQAPPSPGAAQPPGGFPPQNDPFMAMKEETQQRGDQALPARADTSRPQEAQRSIRSPDEMPVETAAQSPTEESWLDNALNPGPEQGMAPTPSIEDLLAMNPKTQPLQAGDAVQPGASIPSPEQLATAMQNLPQEIQAKARDLADAMQPSSDQTGAAQPPDSTQQSQPSRQNQPAQPGQPMEASRQSQPNQGDQSRNGQDGQPGQSQKGQQGQPGQSQPAQPGQSQPAQPGQSQQSQPGQSQQSQPGQQAQPGQANDGQQGQPGASSPGQSKQPEQLAQPGQMQSDSATAQGQGAQSVPPDSLQGRGISPARAEELAIEAENLAARQDQLAEEMSALAEADEEMLLDMQDQHLAERLSDIANDARALALGAAELMPQSGPVQSMKDQSLARISQADQIADAMIESFEDSDSAPLPSGNLPQILSEAARFLQGLGQSIPTQPADAESPAAESMANAYEAVSQAASTPGGNQATATHAANSMAQAAQQAAQTAMAMGLNPGGVSSTGGGADGFTRNVPDGALLEIGISRSDWMRLPGELRDEILQAAAEEGPEEYRPLIRRYFRDIATRSHRSRRTRTGR